MRVTRHDFEGQAITLHEAEGGRIWFLGGEITALLGYADSAEALHRYCHQRGVSFGDGASPVSWIDVENVYRLIFNSTLPRARRLGDWLATTLLPRLYGSAQPLPVPLVTRGLRLRNIHWQGERWIALRDALPLLSE